MMYAAALPQSNGDAHPPNTTVLKERYLPSKPRATPYLRSSGCTGSVWKVSLKSATIASTSLSAPACDSRCIAFSMTSLPRGSTILSPTRTNELTPERRRSVTMRVLTLPSARTLTMQANFDTATWPNFAVTSAQLLYTVA